LAAPVADPTPTGAASHEGSFELFLYGWNVDHQQLGDPLGVTGSDLGIHAEGFCLVNL